MLFKRGDIIAHRIMWGDMEYYLILSEGYDYTIWPLYYRLSVSHEQSYTRDYLESEFILISDILREEYG